MGSLLSFPRCVDQWLRVRKRRRTQRGRVLRLIQDPFSNDEFGKISSARQANSLVARTADSSSRNAVSFSAAPFLHGDYKTKLTANSCMAICSSTNAVNISSARSEEH